MDKPIKEENEENEENEEENEEEEDPRDSIKRATLKSADKYILKRIDSIGVQQQGKTTCFSHSSTRCIMKLFTHFLPELFDLTEQDKHNLYPEDPYLNCFNESENIEVVRTKLAKETKCPIQNRNNFMIVFYYTLFRINKKFNINGRRVPIIVLSYFVNKLDKFYRLREEVTTENMVISKDVDTAVKAIILQYKDYVNKNNIYITAKRDLVNTNGQNETHNWITDFPLGAREALADGLYISFGFYMTKKSFDELKKDPFNKLVQTFPSNIENPSNFGHTVIIKDWSPEAGVTILNSWGAKWGYKGYLVVPPKYYYKFVDNNFTGFFWGNKMDFTYLKINHGSHFFRDRFGSFFGGKSRKSGKSRKRIGKKSKKKR